MGGGGKCLPKRLWQTYFTYISEGLNACMDRLQQNKCPKLPVGGEEPFRQCSNYKGASIEISNPTDDKYRGPG